MLIFGTETDYNNKTNKQQKKKQQTLVSEENLVSKVIKFINTLNLNVQC